MLALGILAFTLVLLRAYFHTVMFSFMRQFTENLHTFCGAYILAVCIANVVFAGALVLPVLVS